jgi:hypothetical protein
MDYEIVDIRTVKRTELKFNLPDEILDAINSLGKNDGLKISLDDATKTATHRTRIKAFRDANPKLEEKYKFRLHRNQDENDTEYSLYISRR